jgi:hypothetical protein
VKGNFHARFLGGRGRVNRSRLPGAALRATISRYNCSKIMTHKLPFIFFFIVFAIMTYRWWFGRRRDGRPGIRHITRFGVVFCTASLGFWVATRFEDILAIFSSPREASVFATPWLWVSSLCVGFTLLLVSFFTRVKHDHAA